MLKRFSAALSVLTMLAGLQLGAPFAHADITAVADEVNDSIVLLKITYTGRVLIPGERLKNGRDTWSDPVSTDYQCSGFVVDPAGFISTAGHCVEIDRGVRFDLRQAAVMAAFERGALTEPNQDRLTTVAMTEQWPVQGEDPETEVARRVEVIQPEDPDRRLDSWVTAKLVEFQRFDDGDNALLKLSGFPPLKPLIIADSVPKVGQTITAVGFPGSFDEVTDPDRIRQPSFKTGTVSSHQAMPSGAPTLEINAQVSPGMSGGPTVDEQGHVVGANSFGIGETTQGFEFVTDTDTLRNFLQRNGVALVAAPVESAFPWAWVLLGVVVVVAAAIITTILLRPKWFGLTKRRTTKRRRRPRKRATAKPAESAPAAAEVTPTEAQAFKVESSPPNGESKKR